MTWTNGNLLNKQTCGPGPRLNTLLARSCREQCYECYLASHTNTSHRAPCAFTRAYLFVQEVNTLIFFPLAFFITLAPNGNNQTSEMCSSRALPERILFAVIVVSKCLLTVHFQFPPPQTNHPHSPPNFLPHTWLALGPCLHLAPDVLAHWVLLTRDATVHPLPWRFLQGHHAWAIGMHPAKVWPFCHSGAEELSFGG